jgi:CSLREA domain-containing protein
MVRKALGLALMLLVLVPAANAMAAPQTFTVTRTDDPAPGACSVGDCSLREAITAANGNNNVGDTDEIGFLLGTGNDTVSVTSGLPAITQSVTIDGCNDEPGHTAPCTGLRYASTGSDPDGLDLTGGLTTIRGLAITNFGFGIVVASSSPLDLIANNWLGVKLDGTPEVNRETNVIVAATGVTIGGTAAGTGNVIANSGTGAGIAVNAADFVTIQGNRIGVDAAGNALGNDEWGILVQPNNGDPATDVTIGGNSAAAENVISNNGFDAISINAASINTPATNDVKRIDVLRNRGTGNAGLFIDLDPFDGPGVSDVIAPNGRIIAPFIASATSESASGNADHGATVRLFRRETDDAGRLDEFIGQATADDVGHWSLSYAPLPPDQFVTATQTVSTKGTSELASDFAYIDVTPRGEASPPATAAGVPAPTGGTRKKCKKHRKLRHDRCVHKKRKHK